MNPSFGTMLNEKRKKLPDHVGVQQYKLQVSLAMEEQGTINNKKQIL